MSRIGKNIRISYDFGEIWLMCVMSKSQNKTLVKSWHLWLCHSWCPVATNFPICGIIGIKITETAAWNNPTVRYYLGVRITAKHRNDAVMAQHLNYCNTDADRLFKVPQQIQRVVVDTEVWHCATHKRRGENTDYCLPLHTLHLKVLGGYTVFW